MSLRDWIKNGWLVKHESSQAEISDVGVYERAGVVSDHEADQIIKLAETIRDQVTWRLKKNHPELIGG